MAKQQGLSSVPPHTTTRGQFEKPRKSMFARGCQVAMPSSLCQSEESWVCVGWAPCASCLGGSLQSSRSSLVPQRGDLVGDQRLKASCPRSSSSCALKRHEALCLCRHNLRRRRTLCVCLAKSAGCGHGSEDRNRIYREAPSPVSISLGLRKRKKGVWACFPRSAFRSGVRGQR